ncbi:MAG TPA: SNF2-related protein, partial [Candidatus Saccharimonadales bacterium]|nr:SNF2-related protein [Candidatus Saccharimonadales bacterium]
MKPHSPETSVSPEFEGSVDSSEMSDTQFIVDRAATIDEVEISVDSDTVDKKVGADVEEKWLTRNNLALDLGVSWDPVKRLSELCRDDHPEWFETKKNDGGMLVEHLHPDLVELIRGELSGYDAPEEKDYISIRDAAGELDLSEPALRGILRKKYAEQVRVYRTARGKMARHISNDLLAQIKQERGQHELVPEGWDTSKGASKTLGISQKFVERFIDDYRETHPHWFRTFKSQKSGQLNINLSPELIKLIKEERGRYDRAPEEWMTSTGVAQDLGDEGLRRLVGNIANTFRGDRPEWFETYRDKVGTPRLHYHPELISEILRLLEEKRLDFDLSQHQKFEKEGLQNKIQEFLIEVEGGKTLEAQEFQKLIQLFGSERAVDILFQYRPDYKKIDVPFVRRIIGEYLGDFLSLKPDLNLEDLEEGVEYLAEPSLKEGLTEVVKNDALRFYNERHRAHPEQADLDIFALYVDNLRTQTAGYSTTELAEVVDEVARYYNSLFEISKPNNLVDQLKDGRLFPDVNQRINIKEIKMKHKMLIADEMGVGKSASAILAKETLGVKQALIVVPSNVVEVWQKYLSNQSAANGEAEGYFKVGQAPRVLTIESLKQLSAVNPDDYDYIILSQERLTSHYVEALEAFNYGMLIVDEVHKLKNIGQGKRAENLIELAARIDQGDDAKYLALLSGTPVPNKVGDVAMVLRLLYPEKFDHISNQELMYQI